MFNSGNLKVAKGDYETAEQTYHDSYKSMVDSSQLLYTSKNSLVAFIRQQKVAKDQLDTIDDVLRYRNLQLEVRSFEQVEERTQRQINENLAAKGNNGMVGVAAGTAAAVAGVAAPSALMALTTTFGVASTGTAISTLSGAALTNATLAAIGGGSMAAGSAVLSVLGPIGIISGLVIMSVTGFRTNKKNKAAIEQYDAASNKLTNATSVNRHATDRISELDDKISGVLQSVGTAEFNSLSLSNQLKKLLSAAELLNTPVTGD
ncbi:hypothetical protein [Lactiplantibacillus pentosus]